MVIGRTSLSHERRHSIFACRSPRSPFWPPRLRSRPLEPGDAVPLSLVAADLGFTYDYLPVENAVSLTRPGTVIVVRPGDGFFSVNARREPVYGMVPAYRDNDVVVSRAFEAEIKQLGRPTARTAAGPSWTHAAAKSTSSVAFAPGVAAGTVTTVSASYVVSEGAVQIAGTATPGARRRSSPRRSGG